MTQRYASRTTVTVERSKAEVEHILRRHGADQFLHGWETGRAIVGFRLKGHVHRPDGGHERHANQTGGT